MNYYLNYSEKDNLNSYVDFIKLLENNIKKYISKEFPFIGGEFEKKYKIKLKDKILTDSGMTFDELAREMSTYFIGLIRWHSPYAFFNVKSPVNIYAAATSAISSLYDGNLANDKICGNMAAAEMEVIKYLSEVAGYDDKSSGYFTFGGTSTLLNALKLGLNRAFPNISNCGIRKNAFVVCSEQEHHSIIKCCDWLGIGKDNCLMVSTDENLQLDIRRAETIIDERIGCGQSLVAIVASGGTTAQNIIDPIYELNLMRERIKNKHCLQYTPYLHVDSVIGWPVLFFGDYSFDENALKIPKRILDIISIAYESLKHIKCADSFGVDFHKTGFCPFSSSAFVVKNKNEFFDLGERKNDNLDDIVYGEYNPCDYVLETSRPVSGAISALTVLKLLGKNGIRTELAKIVDSNLYIRTLMNKLEDFEIINDETFGINITFIVKPSNYPYNYKDMHKMNITKAYRLAKYNYNFYLFCMKHIERSNLFFNYSSGTEKGHNGVFMGVLQMQSFSPVLSVDDSKKIIAILQSLKEKYDCTKETIYKNDLPFEPHKFKYSYKLQHK